MKIHSSLKSASFYSASLLFIVLTTSTKISNAQQEQDTLRATLDPVEVKAAHSIVSSENSTFSLSILSNSDEKLTHSAPITLDNLFSNTPGIWVNDRENYALGERITIRGIGWRAQFGVRGIQVVMDGIPLTMADGQAMTNVIDPMFIRRAELVRGPSSMFWGNSSGGVLYLSTVPPTNTNAPFLVRGTVGSYGLKKSDIQFTQRYGNHGVSAYGSYLDQAGYRDHSEVELGRAGITGAVDLSPDSRIEYFGAYASMPYAEHPSGLTKQQARENPDQANSTFEQFGAGKEISQGQFGVSFSNNNSFGFFKGTLYGIFRELKNPLPFATIDLSRRSGGGRFTIQKSTGQFSFNVGAETKLQRDDRNEYVDNSAGTRDSLSVDQVEKVFNQGLFITSTYNIDKLQILGSLRYDWIRFDADAENASQSGNRDFQSLSPGVGVNYSLGDIEFYSNLSTGFEIPTTTELVNRPDGGNGFNTNLEPEKTLGFEIGSRGYLFSSKLSYDLALYRLWISDLLFPYRLESDETFYRNQGETSHRGIEANVEYEFSPAVQVGLTYNLTDAQFVQAETVDGTSLGDKEIPGVAKHRLSGTLNWRPGKFWFTSDVQYVSRFPVDNLNTAYNEEYIVANGRLSYTDIPLGQQVRFLPFLAVNNVFDTRYNGSVVVNAFGGRYYEPAAGINWRSGFSLQF